MSRALVLTVVALSGVIANGARVGLRGIPTFPSGLADSVAGLGNSFQDNKPPPKDEQPLIKKLKDTAEEVMEEEVAQELRSGEAKKAAYLLASQGVVKLVYIGGCSRAYSEPCPKGWGEASVRMPLALRPVKYIVGTRIQGTLDVYHDHRRRGHVCRRRVRWVCLWSTKDLSEGQD